MSDNEKIIFTGNGMPFQTEKAATIQKTRLLNQPVPVQTKVIAVEGGFALKRLFVKAKKRVPFGSRNVLKFDNIPGYEIRVFNDKPEDLGSNIEDAKRAGWEVVTSDDELEDNRAGKTSKMGSAVTKPVGHGVTGVLMKKMKTWYDEDDAEQQARIDLKEKQIQEQTGVRNSYGEIRIRRGQD